MKDCPDCQKRIEASKKWKINNREKYKKYCFRATSKKRAGLRVSAPWLLTYESIEIRCIRKSSTSYPNYGGRGIKMLITKEELKTLWFRDNASDMKKPSIDRIDSTGDYTFSNCRYIEFSENAKRLSQFNKVDRMVTK